MRAFYPRQAYRIPRYAQVCVVALCEGMEAEEVIEEVYRLRRLPGRRAA